jgi:uncharacterized protein YjbI with pentapeptide repeats
MANREHLEILKQGVKVWNRWRRQNPQIKPNLARADLAGLVLAGVDLREALLHRANLAGVNLNGANLENAQLFSANLTNAVLRQTNLHRANAEQAHLERADLTAAVLTGANLSRAYLGEADLTLADVSFADLSSAEIVSAKFFATKLIQTELIASNLHSSVFQQAHLDDANFYDATVGLTVFAKVDLSHAKGLAEIRHMLPSTLGTDTILRSKGKIPEAFLRGCGLPDSMIEFARSIAGNPIEFNSCFISYSSKDEAFAKRLHNDLQANGVRCWFAPHDVKGGKKLHEQIDWAIHFHDRTLLILSPDSINSAWVKTEIAKARKRELEEKRQILFPIRLVEFDVLKKWECFDADTGTDSAKEIREYFIPDFSNWKDHDSYQKAFKDLLRDLKNERTKAAPAPK